MILVLGCVAAEAPVQVGGEVLLARGREVFEGAVADPKIGDVEARLCSWGRGPRGCATGRGASEEDAVELAAVELAGRLSRTDRLALDLVVGERAVGGEVPLEERALRVWRIDGELVGAAEVLLRGPPGEGRWRPAELGAGAEVLVTTWVEDLDGRPRELRGAWFAETPEPARKLLEERARMAAGWLAEAIGEDGRFLYERHPGRPPSEGYNLLRHAGATAELFRAAERFEVPGWAIAGERALAVLLEAAHEREDGSLVIVDAGKVKLGGAGLALYALAAHRRVGGEEDHLADLGTNRLGHLGAARALGRGILAAQDDAGAFTAFQTLDGEALPGSSLHYPGEAILGLVELHAWDGDARWLEGALRGAEHLIEAREALAPEEVPADHWLLIALDRLHELTGEDRWASAQEPLVEAIGPGRRSFTVTSGSSGSPTHAFGNPPRLGPTATRVEGLLARARTCERLGEDCPPVDARALAATGFLLRHQLTRSSGWFLPDDELLGAFPAAPFDLTCRIDTTQHALAVLLDLDTVGQQG